MRVDVVIDDDLIKSAVKASGRRSRKDAIEDALKLLIRVKGEEKIRRFRGKLKWTGNLEEMRPDK